METMEVIDGKVGNKWMIEFLRENRDKVDDLSPEMMIGVKI